MFWALLQAGYEAAKQDGTPRHQIVDAIMASLTAGTINPHGVISFSEQVSSGVPHVHPRSTLPSSAMPEPPKTPAARGWHWPC